MTRAKKPAAAGSKSADTVGAPPVPVDATAPAGATAGAVRAESTAGDEGAPPSASAVSDGAEAGKGDEAAAGTAPEPDAQSVLMAAVEAIPVDALVMSQGATVEFIPAEARFFEAQTTILHDGIEYPAGAPVPLTRSAFEALPQGAVAGDWTD